MTGEEIKIGDENTSEEVKNFSELYNVIIKKGKVIGSDGTEHKADDVIAKINQARKALKGLQKQGGITTLTREAIKKLIKEKSDLMQLIRKITRQEGLRVKVTELAIDEVIERGVSSPAPVEQKTEKKGEKSNGKGKDLPSV